MSAIVTTRSPQASVAVSRRSSPRRGSAQTSARASSGSPPAVVRGETPLRADLHVVAARLTATLETGADGLLRARLMEPAPEGTVARDGVDSLGESTQRLARWQRGR